MKFKKTIMFIITILLTVCLVGCGEQNNEKAVAKSIDKSTANLDSIIQKLDQIKYEDIIIEDISPLKATGDMSEIKDWYAIGTTQRGTYSIKNSSAEKTRNNAKFVSSNKVGAGKQISSAIKNDLNCVDGTCHDKTKAYNSNYTPKYVNEISNSFTRDSLESYLNQIEIVYNNCADCISCNAECKNEMSKLRQSMNECRVLSEKLKDGTITMTESDIASCNSCIDDLGACTNKLNATRDNVAIKERDVTNLKGNFSKNLIALNDAYTKLLSALESRLDYLKGCNDCIDSLCDTINKTNVNIAEAENNRSNQEDIILSEEKIKEESKTNIYENSMLDPQKQTTKNTTKKSSSGRTYNVSSTGKATKSSSQSTNRTKSSNKDHIKMPISQKVNIKNTNKNVLSQAKKMSSKKNIDTSKAQYIERDNVHEKLLVDNRDDNAEASFNKDKINEEMDLNELKNNSIQNSATNQSSALKPETPKPDAKTQNNTPNLNNYPNVPATDPNGYNYNQNYPYGYNGNRPYPPRNIDTYRNIIKNTDTYSPNYMPGNGNNYNNQPFSYTNQNGLNIAMQTQAGEQEIRNFTNENGATQTNSADEQKDATDEFKVHGTMEKELY